MGLDAQVRAVPVTDKLANQPGWRLELPLDMMAQQLKDFARLQRANAHSGTHESYEALIQGRADFDFGGARAFARRKPNSPRASTSNCAPKASRAMA